MVCGRASDRGLARPDRGEVVLRKAKPWWRALATMSANSVVLQWGSREVDKSGPP